MYKEPNFDVAQLAHVEIYTPKPEETLWFFKDLLGMIESGREGQSVYLRGYEDPYHHSLKVTERDQPGLGHVAWRTSSPQALERRVQALEKSGLGQGWSEKETGQGVAYQFKTPDGHPMEVLWEIERCNVEKAQKSRLLNRPQKRPLQGLPVRRLDHVNLLCNNVTRVREAMGEDLGFRLRENIMLNNGTEAAAWISVSPLVHEIALMHDYHQASPRLHHVAFWYGYPQHLMDIADIFREREIQIEVGPGKHGISQAYFLYVFEPGGNRIELFGDAGYLIFEPDWQPITWKEDELELGINWYGATLPDEFLTYGTPDVKPVPTK